MCNQSQGYYISSYDFRKSYLLEYDNNPVNISIAEMALILCNKSDRVCKDCPNKIGDFYERDCCFPDCLY